MRRLCLSMLMLAAMTGLHAQNTNPIAGARQPGGTTSLPNPMWAASGVVGGIPNITNQCGSTISAPSSSSAINSAIQSCNNGFVSLGAGTFNIGSGGIVMKTGVVLRGQGMSTILNMTGTVGSSRWYWGGGACSLVFAGGYINSAVDKGVPPVTSVASGTTRTWTGTNGQAGVYTQGANVINLATAPTGLSVGDMLVLWQSDPPDASVPNAGLFFSDESSSDGVSWQGSYDDANSAVEQRSRVIAITGRR